MTPDELNVLTDEALFSRVDATIRFRAGAGSSVSSGCDVLAQYVTFRLLWRVHTRVVTYKIDGKPAVQKLLAWVVMELTGVIPPPDVRDVETFGNRIDTFLKRQYTQKSTLINKRVTKAEPRAQKQAELDARCCWLTGRPSYIEVYTGPFPEPGSAVPTPTPATRPAGHVPFARSRLPESSTPMEAKETLQDLLQSAFEKGESKGESKAAMASARADAALNRVSEAEAQAREAEAQAREAEAGRQRVEVQNSKLKAAAAATWPPAPPRGGAPQPPP